MNSDHKICSVMQALFHRKGGGGVCVRSIDDWPEYVSSIFILGNDELPVVLGHPGEECEFLISTQYLYVHDKKVKFDDICGVNPHMLGVQSASARDSLEVAVKSGDVIVVKIEPGGVFFGVWSVLIYAASSLGSKGLQPERPVKP